MAARERDPSLSSQNTKMVEPAATESELMKSFIERHRSELIAELAASWKTSAEALRLLEFMKTHGGLNAFESETIAGAGQSGHRAQALVSTILSKEDVRSLWKSFWLGVHQFHHQSIFKKFSLAIEDEIGYFALTGISVGPPTREPTHKVTGDGSRPLLGVPELSLDSLSGVSDQEGSTRPTATTPGKTSSDDWEEKAKLYYEQRNVASRERKEAVESNYQLTNEIYTIKNKNAANLKLIDSLQAANKQLKEENVQLTQRNVELSAEVEGIRDNHRTQLETTQSTMQQLLVMQDQEKKRQREILNFTYRLQQQEEKLIQRTTLYEEAMKQLNTEKATVLELQRDVEQARHDFEDAQKEIRTSVPLTCVNFAQCRHSVSDSGVQSEISAVIHSNERPVLFMREVDLDIQLPLDHDCSSGIIADSALVIKGIADKTMTDGSKLLVGDEVREVNGDACSNKSDFVRILSDPEKTSLNMSVRRRLVLPDCKSCVQHVIGPMSSPLSSAPPAGVFANFEKRVSNAGCGLPPVAMSPIPSDVLPRPLPRPESGAGMCAVSSASSTVHHKAEITAACSTEHLPEELSVSGKSSVDGPSPELLHVLPAPILKPVRVVRLNVEELRAKSDSEGSPSMRNRDRSHSIPHLALQAHRFPRRASLPPVAGGTGVRVIPLPNTDSQSAERMSLSKEKTSEGYRKVDQPLHLNEEQLKRIGAGHSGRRLIALYKPQQATDDLGLPEEWELVGGRGCGTYIRSAPEWVLSHGVRPGDRILYVQSKDVRNAPLEQTQFWIENTVSFSKIVHIVVETDEEQYNKVNNGELKENFYVRSNYNYLASKPGQLNIGYGDILHIKDTMPNGQVDGWLGCKVEHYRDTEKAGSILCPRVARGHILEANKFRNVESAPSIAAEQETAEFPEEDTTSHCSPRHRSRASLAGAQQDEEEESRTSGGLMQRALHLFGRGGGNRRGSRTVTQIMSDMAGGSVPTATPPYEYIELIREERSRPVILFGSFTHLLLRELEKQYSSHYRTCEKIYYASRAERNLHMERGDVVYAQPIEMMAGFQCITIDAVRDCLNSDLCPLLESDMSSIRLLQCHDLYAVTICLKPTNKAKFRSFLETLCGRPFSDTEVSDELAGVKASYEAYKHIMSDVLEIKGRCDKDISRLHRLIQKNLRNPSWVSSIDQPDYFFETQQM